jgi:ubiquinone biosynthesis monooxygenase Coq7
MAFSLFPDRAMDSTRHFNPLDKLIVGLDKALRVIGGVATSSRPNPAAHAADGQLDQHEQRQALYNAQARFATSPQMQAQFAQAGREEEDHLAWTAQRLGELGSQPSLLNPLWYAGAYALGVVAAQLGDQRSLGFVVETERQVEDHLNGHLSQLPLQDAKSRAIVEQMRVDEIAHGAAAQALGAIPVPVPAQMAMRAMAKVMTSTAYHI